MTQRILFVLLTSFLISCQQTPERVDIQPDSVSDHYQSLQDSLTRGWNTWNTYNAGSHVKLPEGFCIDLQFHHADSNAFLEKLFFTEGTKEKAKVKALAHTFDGSYTGLEVDWKGLRFKVESAVHDGEQYILITPLQENLEQGYIIPVPRFLWDYPGTIEIEDDKYIALGDTVAIEVFFTAGNKDIDLEDRNPSFAFNMTEPLGISTGRKMDIRSIKKIIKEAGDKHRHYLESFGAMKEVAEAVQTVIAWNTIYDPTKDRVITPVSRIWNTGWDGYVLFCWDNYFVSYMLAPLDKELAFANAVEITHEITESGFIPNFAATHDLKSRDRSQPPVGSRMVLEIYKLHPEDWFLEEVFNELVVWNRWWADHREEDGYLCWGSNPYETRFDDRREKTQNTLQGAKYESGLDNSPMYDDVPFDKNTHLMELADVGLMSLYVMDCEALAEIAGILDSKGIQKELKHRAKYYRENLHELWNGEYGIYLNKRTDNGDFSYRISPTNLYPLLAKAPTQEQAEIMMEKNFYDPGIFWGEYIIPSIARNDPAYPDNSYWRGRIWAPMNFLVYLGMLNYDLPQARHDLAVKSMELMMKNWREKRHICENFNAGTGVGKDVRNSDPFYHWGALLGLIYMMEEGYLETE